ncbi:hypothetical protein [Herbaspirillum sp.]|uniref:hypothetical protein n=1 Tax=Herbaspirillum sp. TaxID=1890675 RepID=UPI00257AEE4D|nr:hypothetical protein [Herbaspirillum sp.]
MNQIDGHRNDIDTLFLASEAIGPRLVPDLNEITLTELAKEIVAMKATIEKLNIDDRLKKIISDQLHLILISINAYGALGPEGAAKIYGGAVAELVRLSHQEAAKPEEKTAISKAIGVAKKVGAIVVWAAAVVSGASELLEDGTQLLGMSGVEEEPSSDD